MIDNAEIGVEDNLELNFVRETYPKRKAVVTGELKVISFISPVHISRILG